MAIFSLFLSILLVCSVFAQTELQRLEAAYIQKIINYVDWPGTGEGEFVISVSGDDELLARLSEAFTGPVRGKTVRVVKSTKASSPEVRIICLSGEKDDIPSHHGLLVITRHEKSFRDGAVINFVLEGEKLRFDIDNTEAQRRGLKINSRLLNLARNLK